MKADDSALQLIQITNRLLWGLMLLGSVWILIDASLADYRQLRQVSFTETGC